MNKISISGAAFSVNHCARLIGIVYPVQPAFPRARQIFFFDASTAFYIAILSSGYPSRAFKMFPERKKREKLLPQNSFLYNTHLLSISARRKIPKDSFWPRDFLHRFAIRHRGPGHGDQPTGTVPNAREYLYGLLSNERG